MVDHPDRLIGALLPPRSESSRADVAALLRTLQAAAAKEWGAVGMQCPSCVRVRCAPVVPTAKRPAAAQCGM
jgi:hypothetical protein